VKKNELENKLNVMPYAKKYGDEEYKKLHAKKMADQRKKKNN